MARNSDAYERMKDKMAGVSSSSKAGSLLKNESTYWIGAAGLAGLFVGFMDGGISVALAYGAKKIHEAANK